MLKSPTLIEARRNESTPTWRNRCSRRSDDKRRLLGHLVNSQNTQVLVFPRSCLQSTHCAAGARRLRR